MDDIESYLRIVSPTAFCGGTWECYDSHDSLDEYCKVHSDNVNEYEVWNKLHKFLPEVVLIALTGGSATTY
jgi:hypothetical protein